MSLETNVGKWCEEKLRSVHLKIYIIVAMCNMEMNEINIINLYIKRIIKNDKYIINLYLQNCNTKNSVEQLLNHQRELLNCCGEN